MSDQLETLSAILAEMRREERPYGISNDRLRFYADRIERAAKNTESAFGMALAIEDGLHKRDKQSAPGNAAAMREALEEIHNEAQNICDYCDEQRIVSHRADKIERIVNTALAAPPRNCDVGTAEEQAERFEQFCLDNHSAEHLCSRCPLGKQLGNDVDMCQLHWAQMPYAPAEGCAE